jgi:hypothetical protein
VTKHPEDDKDRDRDIEKLHRDSAQMSDLEDMYRTSRSIGDKDGADQAAHGFFHVMRKGSGN